MLLDFAEAFGDLITDLFDTTDAVEGVAETSELTALGESAAPMSNDVQETIAFLQGPSEVTESGLGYPEGGTNTVFEMDSAQLPPPVETMPNGMVDYAKANRRLFAELSELSPEELNARVGSLEAQAGAQDLSSNIRSSVGESMDSLAEAKAKTFDPGRLTPFESGITLSDSNVPHDVSEFRQHANGILERGGQFYRQYGDGTYRPVTSDGAWK